MGKAAKFFLSFALILIIVMFLASFAYVQGVLLPQQQALERELMIYSTKKDALGKQQDSLESTRDALKQKILQEQKDKASQESMQAAILLEQQQILEQQRQQALLQQQQAQQKPQKVTRAS